MWSGIKAVYFGVPSKRVEEITGFDEGFKPNWFDEFKNAELPFTEISKARPAKKFCAAMLPQAKKFISRKGHKNSLGKNI